MSVLDVAAPLAAPAITLLLGAVVAVAWRPPDWLPGLAQHLAAGVVFASVAVELIPAIRQRSPVLTVVGFLAGIGLMLGMRVGLRGLRAVGETEDEAEDSADGRAAGKARGRLPLGFVGASSVDLLVDGLVLGASFAVGHAAGLIVAFAMALEDGFLGFSNALALRASRIPAASTLGIAALIAGVFVVGAAVGLFALGGAPDAVLGLAIGIGAVALMYLVTEELLVRAHEAGESEANVTAFFVGFLLVLVLAEIR